jgi:NodT family efflux transporter outer membrane factor (OMF) lipoprotein
MMPGRLIVAVLLATGAGCTVGPDFVRPDPPRDRAYLADPASETVSVPDVLGGAAQRFVADLDIPAQWWEVYQSAALNELIERSLRANPDIQTAIQSLKAAQANAKATRAALFPPVTASGSGTHNEQSAAISPTPSSGSTVFGLFTGLLNITYLIDLWGGTRRAGESAEAQAEAQCFVLEAAYLTLSSNVVVAAVTEASIRGQIDTAERTIAIQRESLTLLQRRFDIGQAARSDVAAQEAALAQSETALPPLRNQLSQQRNLLAQLTGQTTAHPPAETFDLERLALPRALPVSVPARLVSQRPDIRSAEANVHAAAATVGVQTAALLPQFTFNLSYGSTATSLDMLFSSALGPTTLVGASVTQTLLDGGANWQRRKAAIAAWEQAKSQYRSTVLTAFRNVADSLRTIEFDALTLQAAAHAEKAARLSLDITRRRQQAGDAGILDMLNAELTYQTAALALVQARASRFADTAALFQSLGGGWWNRDAQGLTSGKRPECRAPTNPPAPQPWPGNKPAPSPSGNIPPIAEARRPAPTAARKAWPRSRPRAGFTPRVIA